MYKPNFCAHCGGQIIRDRWHLWTSRRFCPECAPRFRTTHLLLPLIAGVTLFGLGAGLGSRARSTVPPLIIQQGPSSWASTQAAPARPLSGHTQAGGPPVPAAPELKTRAGTAEPAAEQTEVVSICGALTKKGTPCQRRVRGTGRCYQHKGQAAIIPPEQRVIAGH